MYSISELQAKRVDSSFFSLPTLEVCKNLLGKKLVVTKNSHLQVAEILEVEAYIGQEDLACHASKGRTPRTEIMFGPPGRLYVYFIYGMYHLLNIITENEGYPAGILIRSLKPIQGINSSLNGPGKLTKALNITRDDLGIDLTQSHEIFISSLDTSPVSFSASPRIGISYAKEPWLSLPWRFTLI